MLQGFFTPGEPDTTGDYEDRVRKRRLAEALMAQGMDYSPVKSWTQGAARIAQALVGGYESGKYDREQKAADAPGRAILEAERQRLMGGSASPAMQRVPGSMANASGEPNPRLIASESGGNWQARNDAVGAGGKVGHFGRLQFGQARLQDAINAGAIPAGTTPEQFMASPELQKAAERWHFADINKAIASGPAGRAIGSVINGVTVTRQGLEAVAHLGGVGGMNRFIETGGRYNPADANGTTLMDYLKRHAGGSPAPVQTASLDGLPPGPVASDAPPMAYAPGQQAIANAMPQNPPMPPPRPGAALVGAVGGQQPQPVTSPPIPQPDGSQRLLAAALSSSASPQLRAQLMQLYQMTQAKADFDFQVAGDQLYRINKRTGQAEPVPGVSAAKPSDVQKQFEQAKREGFQGTLLDYQKALAEARRPQTNVNVNNSADNKFDDTIGTETAKLFIEAAKEGPTARADVGRVRQLRGLIETLPGGFLGGAEALASRYGIKLGPNASRIEAAEAIINQLVPAQRPPGSGTMSDRDVDLFKSSLPSLSNTPQGNKIILDTMEAMAQYKAAQAAIASEVVTKRISRDEGLRKLQELPDPFEAFKGFAGAQPLAPAPARAPAPNTFSDDEIQAEMKRRGLL